jgi:MtrB/PioB family decaheme-associated outer membrane protein
MTPQQLIRDGGKMSRSYVGSAARALCGTAFALCVVTVPGWVQAEEIATLEDVPPHYTMNASTVELGLLYNSDEDYYFGDFRGTEDGHLFLLGNLDLRGRRTFDSGSTRYWRLRASNLGIDSRILRFEYGRQGKFNLFLDYDQIPKLQSDTGYKFMGGDGGTGMTLPAGWVAATTPAGMTELSSSLRDLEVDHERRDLGVGFSFLFNEDWSVSSQFNHETKKGTKTMAGLIAVTGGNPRAALFPSPINYATNQFDLGFERATEKAQFQINYYNSRFNNRDDSVTWQNPYASPGGWDPAAAYPTGVGQKALPPDNQFHQVSLAAGYDLPARSRVTFNAAFGRMTQDETFLPYTINPALTVTTPLPRTSLDGEINTTVMDLRLISRPIEDLTLNAHYRYDDRDNESSHDTYIYIPSDATDQGAIDESRARINHPVSLTKTEFGLGGRYRIAKATHLSLDYKHERVERTFAEVDNTHENEIRAKLQTRPLRNLTLGLKAGGARRDASSYRHNLPYLTGHSPEYIALQSGVGLWENHPLLRRFYLWDRDKLDLGAFATWMPMERLSFSLNARNVKEDFDDPVIGLKDRTGTNITLDASFSPMEYLTAHAFYSFDQMKYGQNGWYFQGFAKAAQASDPDRRWSTNNKDRTNTLGFGFNWAAIKDKLDVEFDYLYVKSNESTDTNEGPALGASVPFPDTVSRLHNLRVGVDYALRENMTFKLGYLFEKFDRSDWAYSGVDPATMSQVISLGETTPDDSNHMLTWSIVYKFW